MVDDKEIKRGHIVYYPFIIGTVPHRLTGFDVTKFKTTKINSEGFLWLFMKINTPEDYPPYGTNKFDTLWKVTKQQHARV